MRLAIYIFLICFSIACGVKAPPLPPLPMTPEQAERLEPSNHPHSQPSPRISP